MAIVWIGGRPIRKSTLRVNGLPAGSRNSFNGPHRRRGSFNRRDFLKYLRFPVSAPLTLAPPVVRNARQTADVPIADET